MVRVSAWTKLRTLLMSLDISRLDYPWEATDIHEHDRLAEADKTKK
jgi:hypothetical protein